MTQGDTIEHVTTPKPRDASHVRRRAGALVPGSMPDIASLILTHGRDVYCVLEPDLHCSSLSQNWRALSGFTAEEDLGAEFKSRIAPDHVKKICAWLARPRAEEPVCFQLKHQDGEWRWLELQRIQENETPAPASACLLRDITDKVRAEHLLEKTRLDSELALHARSEFLANMSHELRTPLNAILGFSQMMRSGTFGELGHAKYDDYASNIETSGATLLSKINDLLELAHIDAGRLELRESATDLHDLIRSAIEFHSHRAFARQVQMRDRVPSAPILAQVDRIRMLQVVTNLLSNAIKYSPVGDTVDLYAETRKDGGINLVVRDNGAGIPPQHLKSILSAFRQHDSFFSRSRDCVGLGLAISKEIVKLHQGRIEIESQPGKGTLMKIWLPKARSLPQAVCEKA